uniref:Uncharacterized protein n=1 Tax=Meloidogyne enterolobii TaxID=390850 RepID=A0A6V7W325_MELEN|nr:unnamed protein product [Meloidogyne enterolobii]
MLRDKFCCQNMLAIHHFLSSALRLSRGCQHKFLLLLELGT